MSRQRITASRIRSHETLIYRTSAHARAAASGLFGTLLLAAIGILAALTIWPSNADIFGAASPVEDFRRSGWERFAPFVLAAVSVLALASLAYSIHRTIRWRFERQINRLSASIPSDDATMVDPTSDGRAVATGLPLPRIQWERAKRRSGLSLRPLTPTTNIVGEARMEIVYLRLFDNEHRHVSFVKGSWREFGSVSMLRSAASMNPAEARRARHVGLDTLFVTTRAQLDTAISAVGNAPRFGIHRVDAGSTRVTIRDRYGAYPMRSVLCASAIWRAAVDHLLDAADLVVIDLSGYTSRRTGTRYEVQRVLDRVPAERILFLADPVSKPKILEEAIVNAWSQMAADSPNAAHPEIPLLIARVDRIVKTIDSENQTSTLELVTSRKETRGLLAGVQQRLRNARPIVPVLDSPGGATDPDEVDPWKAYSSPDASAVSEAPRHASGSTNGSPTSVAPPTHPTKRTRRWILVAAAVLLVAAGVGGAAAIITDDLTQVDQGAPSATGQSQQLDIASCDGYVVQLGALSTESSARRRLAEVAEALGESAATMRFGWIHDAPCGWSSEKPDTYFPVAGPFDNSQDAETACRQVRAAQVEHGQTDLAGYRPLDDDFIRCG